MMSQAQVESARTDGFVCPVPVMTKAAADRYLSCFDAYQRDHGTDIDHHTQVKTHLLFTWMMEMGRTPALLDAMEDLIGPDIMMVVSRMWVKNPLDGSFTTWHQDSAYFDYDPPEVWSAWIALTDSREEHGCLRYGRGTHLGPSLSHVETEDDKNLLSRGQYIPDFDDSSMALAEVNAGEAVLHHFRCAHSSLPNTTDHRRIGVLFVYCPTNVRATLGRYSGTCVRGEDKFGYWDAEPAVKRDLDPAALDYVRGLNARYFDKVVRSEAEREQTSG